uniref:AlNc14C530G12061 protein n=1 Tax=Albugo laibachii Nc14 TaxID=890382 RepID=F0X0X0_9STRA|nr:AlNc14C530G12061 [Albugo laibachii Nc14]|eukprot:CCA27416.1 AlNc14C530G12061 [Albugo laibachii Nc14]
MIDSDRDDNVPFLRDRSLNNNDIEVDAIQEIHPSVGTDLSTVVEPLPSQLTAAGAMDVEDNSTSDDHDKTVAVPWGGYVHNTGDIDFWKTPRHQRGERDQQLALPNSEHLSAIFPHEGDSADQGTRPNKRPRLLFEHYFAAVEVPTRYRVVRKSPEAPKWFQTIQEEMKARRRSQHGPLSGINLVRKLSKPNGCSQSRGMTRETPNIIKRGLSHLFIVRKKGSIILIRTLQLQI